MPPPLSKEKNAKPYLRRRQYILVLLLFAALVFGTHAPFLQLPLFWDELAFVPAALDLFQKGAWVPISVPPTVHPPLVMVYLAGIWSVVGYSLLATRVAMLLLAVLSLMAVLRLALDVLQTTLFELVWTVPVLLFLTPLWTAQAMLAQLDLPAMLGATMALLLFLRDRIGACAVACTGLVLVKETGAIFPMVFFLWLLWERRFRVASHFLVPAVALLAWLALLKWKTGSVFGGEAFASYTLYEPLRHPARVAMAFARRVYFLFFADLRWIGTVAILWAVCRSRVFVSRSWRILFTVIAGQMVVVSVLGGAVLDRYLLPVLPLIYLTMAASWSVRGLAWRRISTLALAAALVMGNFWSPPYSLPYESNLAFTDFIQLHAEVAQYLELKFPQRQIMTAWPLSAELTHPAYGYVSHPLIVYELPDFQPATLFAQKAISPDVFVFYSRSWEPTWRPLRGTPLATFWRRTFGSNAQISSADLQNWLHLARVSRWERRGQWVEIYTKPASSGTT